MKIDRRGSGRASPKATLLRSRVKSVPDLAQKLAFGSLSSRSTRRNLTFSRYRQYVLEIDISKFVTSFIVCKFFNIVSKIADTDLPNSQRTFFSTISSEKT